MQSEGNQQASLAENTVQFITTSEGMLLGAVFLLSSFAGVSRAMRDNDYVSASQLASIAFFSGFVGVGTVSILRHFAGMDSASNVLCLGIACVVGLLGKEQDKLLRFIIKAALKKIGAEDYDKE